MLTNRLRRSGDTSAPVISQPLGPVRKRRISPVVTSAASIWLLPSLAYGPRFSAVGETSVWIQSVPAESKRRPSGLPKPFSSPPRAKTLQRNSVAAGLAPAHDLAVDVVGARVGTVDAGLPVPAALGVVGERDVDVAVARVDGDPFRPVHLRRAGRVGREARVDERLRRRRQGQPASRTVRVEARDVERAAVEQVAAFPVPGPRADELVDVLEGLVVAHVDGEAAVL